jgi:hypothetical protein
MSHSEALNTPGCFSVIFPREDVSSRDRSSLLFDAAVSSHFPRARVSFLVQSRPFVALVLSIKAAHISLRCKHVNDRFLLPRGEKFLNIYIYSRFCRLCNIYIFSENFGFPCTIYIPSASPQSSSLSPEVGRLGQEWPQSQ